MTEQKTKFRTKKSTPLPLGVRKEQKTVCFSISVPNASECKLNIYEKGKKDIYESVLMTEEHKTGTIFSIAIENFDYENYEYMYESNGIEFMDPYVKRISGRKKWGEYLSPEKSSLVRADFEFPSYLWEDDKPLKIPFHQLILYRLHVRGFTKDSSSKVKNRGMFDGIIEKIPYLVSLGINAVEILPAYEFNEIIYDKTQQMGGGDVNPLEPARAAAQTKETDSYETRFIDYTKKKSDKKLESAKPVPYRINYWGYAKENYYFAPKNSYAVSDSVKELKDLVKSLHANGIELIMEFHFEPGTNEQLISECLRYWALEYHIDGFHVNQNAVPVKLIATDPVLADVKLLGMVWNSDEIYEKEFVPVYKNLAEINDGFQNDVRSYLKGDEKQVSNVAFRMRRNPEKMAVINYITNTNGFTLADLFSYDVKHNMENGENGNDGTDYNYSWNCGAEGNTKRTKVLELRRIQIQNAMVFLLFSQGVPMILAGDEFGNTQKGNNNAYCQDNKISWLNWKQAEKNLPLVEFVQSLISIRKEHIILHRQNEMRCSDYASLGCPEISYHGTKAWYPDYSNYSRVLGILLCGKYAAIDRKKHDNYFYFAINMHWEDHEFDLPVLPEKINWRVLIETGASPGKEINVKNNEMDNLENQKKYKVKARMITILIGKYNETVENNNKIKCKMKLQNDK